MLSYNIFFARATAKELMRRVNVGIILWKSFFSLCQVMKTILSLKEVNHFNVANTSERKSFRNILKSTSDVKRLLLVANMRYCKLTVTPSHMKLLEGAAVVCC